MDQQQHLFPPHLCQFPYQQIPFIAKSPLFSQILIQPSISDIDLVKFTKPFSYSERSEQIFNSPPFSLLSIPVTQIPTNKDLFYNQYFLGIYQIVQHIFKDEPSSSLSSSSSSSLSNYIKSLIKRPNPRYTPLKLPLLGIPSFPSRVAKAKLPSTIIDPDPIYYQTEPNSIFYSKPQLPPPIHDYPNIVNITENFTIDSIGDGEEWGSAKIRPQLQILLTFAVVRLDNKVDSAIDRTPASPIRLL